MIKREVKLRKEFKFIQDYCDKFSKSPENDALIEKIDNIPQIEFKVPKNYSPLV